MGRVNKARHVIGRLEPPAPRVKMWMTSIQALFIRSPTCCRGNFRSSATCCPRKSAARRAPPAEASGVREELGRECGPGPAPEGGRDWALAPEAGRDWAPDPEAGRDWPLAPETGRDWPLTPASLPPLPPIPPLTPSPLPAPAPLPPPLTPPPLPPPAPKADRDWPLAPEEGLDWLTVPEAGRDGPPAPVEVRDWLSATEVGLDWTPVLGCCATPLFWVPTPTSHTVSASNSFQMLSSCV